MVTICLIYFSVLLFLSLLSLVSRIYFSILDYMVMFEIEILSLNTYSIVIILLFDSMSLVFISFVIFISSIVIYYSEDYIEGVLTLNQFLC